MRRFFGFLVTAGALVVAALVGYSLVLSWLNPLPLTIESVDGRPLITATQPATIAVSNDLDNSGYDISYPQCKGELPTKFVGFAIVGLNGGKPFTANLPREESSRYPFAQQFGLVMDRDTLSERISTRVDRMWEQGLVQEAHSLLQAGIMQGTTAQRALGYAQVIAQIEGKVSQEEAQEETKRATRQYARRQETWFSRDDRITWISPVQNALQRILESIN